MPYVHRLFPRPPSGKNAVIAAVELLCKMSNCSLYETAVKLLYEHCHEFVQHRGDG